MLLRRHADTAINRCGGYRSVNRHRIESGKDLRGELPRRRHDERAGFPTRLVDEMVQNGQNERGCFATARHRTGQNIAALERGGYCLSLNWSRSLEAQLF